MRKHLALLGVAAVIVVAGCGETATDSNGHAVITQPAAQARSTVAQQNQQLQQMEQRTSQADPTQP
jgi:protein involved in sex pheromone biosynthesis